MNPVRHLWRPAQLLVPGLAALASLSGCSEQTPAFAFAGPEIQTVRRGDLRITIDQSAGLEPAVETTIRNLVEGWTGLLYLVPEATTVQEGQVVVEVDVSRKEESRAGQAIAVARALSLRTQAQKNVEIVETELIAAEMAAVSVLLIAEMEFEKFLGKEIAGLGDLPDSAGTNLEMVEKLDELLQAEIADNPDAEAEYAGIADKVRKYLDEDVLQRAMGGMSNLILGRIDLIRLAKAELRLRRDTRDHSRGLVEKEFITRNELQRDELRYDSQLSRVTLSWNDIDLLINYTVQQELIRLRQDEDNAGLELVNTRARNEARRVREQAELESKELEYDLAKERLDNLDRQITNSVLRAPHSGVVVYAKQGRAGTGGQPVEEGMNIRMGQKLITLPDTSKMVVEFTVHESRIEQVALGQQATIRLDAFPDRTFTGQVTTVGYLPSAKGNSTVKNYKTTVTVAGNNFDDALRPGMNAKVEILVDLIRDVLLVRVDAVQRDRSTYYVWKETDADPIAQVIRLGRNNQTHVVVQEGVQEGDRIYLEIPTGMEPPSFSPGTEPALGEQRE